MTASGSRVTAVYRAVSILAQTSPAFRSASYRPARNGGRARPPTTRWTPCYRGSRIAGKPASGMARNDVRSLRPAWPLLLRNHRHRQRRRRTCRCTRSVRPFPPRMASPSTTSPLDGPPASSCNLNHFMPLTTGVDSITPIAHRPAAPKPSASPSPLQKEHGARLFANSAPRRRPQNPDTTSRTTSPEAVSSKLERSLLIAASGNTGRTALLEDGMEWQNRHDQRRRPIPRLPEMQIAEIARIFGVPCTWDSTAPPQQHRAPGHGIRHPHVRPGTVRREEAMERDMLSETGRQTHCIWFDLDGLIRGDSAARAAFNGTMLPEQRLQPQRSPHQRRQNPSAAEGMDESPSRPTWPHDPATRHAQQGRRPENQRAANGNQD